MDTVEFTLNQIWLSIQNAYSIFTTLITGNLLTLFFSVIIFTLSFKFLIMPAMSNIGGSDKSRKDKNNDN